MLCMLLPGFITGRAEAQSAVPMTGNAVVDSANVAHVAFRAANPALAKDDLALARTVVARAHRAWPLASLREYAFLGLGRDIHTDTLFSRFLGKREFADVALIHDANRARRRRSTTIATLRDSTMFPEGVDFDPRTGSFYIESVRTRTIVEFRADGTERIALASGQANIGAARGVRADTVRRVLYATTSGIPQAIRRSHRCCASACRMV